MARCAGAGAIGAVTAMAALACGLAGCTQGTTPFTDPHGLVVAMHSGFTEQVVAAAGPWQEAHPEVKLSLAPYQPSDFAQAMLPRMLTGTNLPDVIIVDASFLSTAGRNGMLEDLSRAPYQAGPLLEGFPRAASAEAHAGAALVGVPADVAPTALFYRKDLLDQAGVTEAELTRSWEGFVSACGRLRSAARAYCVARLPELADAVLRSDLPDGRSLYFSPQGEPLADEPRFARAFALVRAARDARIDAGPPPGSEPWTDLVKRGFFAVQLGGPTTIRRLESLSPASAGKWRAAPLPGNARLAAPSAFCALTAHGARKERAWDFVQTVCLGKHAQVMAWRTARAFPALPAAASSSAAEEPVPFLGGQVVGAAWRAAAAALPVPGPNRLDPYARDAVAMEMDLVVDDGKDFAKAMADARARIRRQMERAAKQ